MRSFIESNTRSIWFKLWRASLIPDTCCRCVPGEKPLAIARSSYGRRGRARLRAAAVGRSSGIPPCRPRAGPRPPPGPPRPVCEVTGLRSAKRSAVTAAWSLAGSARRFCTTGRWSSRLGTARTLARSSGSRRASRVWGLSAAPPRPSSSSWGSSPPMSIPVTNVPSTGPTSTSSSSSSSSPTRAFKSCSVFVDLFCRPSMRRLPASRNSPPVGSGASSTTTVSTSR
mmetsp:Transcript_38060/g.55829  ORF Transcript_38060/g.55829 Transcript_38060/m.55829 type:complete len:227 (-) Transcript_38060:29-709(-)